MTPSRQWFVKPGPDVTMSDVDHFENTFTPLPSDYYEFLIDVNGGVPDNDHRAYSRGVIARFLSLRHPPDDPGDIVSHNGHIRSELGARDVIVFAVDQSGARILLVCDGPLRNEVWRYEQLADSAKPQSSVRWYARPEASMLAESFEAFMASLRSLRR